MSMAEAAGAFAVPQFEKKRKVDVDLSSQQPDVIVKPGMNRNPKSRF